MEWAVKCSKVTCIVIEDIFVVFRTFSSHLCHLQYSPKSTLIYFLSQTCLVYYINSNICHKRVIIILNRGQLSLLVPIVPKLYAHDVISTLKRRLVTSIRRRSNVDITSCAGWASYKQMKVISTENETY